MALTTYPLNNIEYSAEDAELFHCTRTSGVYAADDFSFSVTGADSTVTIGSGIAWIRNSKFSGKVSALKSPESITLGVSDSAYPRIDVIALRFDANSNAVNVVYKQGVASSSPVIPEISQTETVYELYICSVWRNPGSSVISVSDITDLRLDPRYCGIMADSVTNIDTSKINEQARALIESLRSEIDAVKDGSGYILKSGDYMKGTLVFLGKIILTEGVNYGKTEPPTGEEGELFFVEITD
jgi:hypothetical protein